MTIRRMLAMSFILAVAGACDAVPELETRTFTLDNVSGHEAAELIGPYVYSDRVENPGSMSAIDGAVTVRETADNLDKIGRVLAEFDAPRDDVRLHFRLVEAGDFEDEGDLGPVRAEMERVFSFRGYRLAGEAVIMATDGSEVEQRLNSEFAAIVSAGVHWIRPDLIRLDHVELVQDRGSGLRTSVNIRPGQTLVLGGSGRGGAEEALFLTVEARSGGATGGL